MALKYNSLLVIRLDAAADSSGKLHIWLHDGNTLGVLGAKLSINEEVDKVVLSSFLESLDGETLETNISLVGVLNELTNKLGEWELADQKIGGLLIFLDFACSDGTLL